MPSLEWATLVLEKYFNFPSSLISNSCAWLFLSLSLSIGWVIPCFNNIIHIYKKGCNFPCSWMFYKKDIESLALLVFCSSHSLCESPRPCSRGAVSSHIVLSLHALLPPKLSSKRGGGSIFTSSSKSPCKKALLTSNCCKYQSKLSAKDYNTCTVFIVAAGTNVSW